MFFKPINKYAHTIIPQLHTPIVKGRREKRLRGVECEPLSSDNLDSFLVEVLDSVPFTRLLLDSNFVSITDMVATCLAVAL